ncbi:hypothetical protein IscW_ISCW008567 [Ixodes scapularis]|uniref:Choline/carnitine acyltransferase domain-containing protein n=1 Tax=Ixodes scapularis TaxID=6945 RepID=B7PXD4_IXOSC|nr:hypothetical protein IscW_ISCW008567 [Ixodes scapularis]|eukprot:XP_002400297.1 hypothetical protein IscW_ISCW008567 [Ixodes scapularis]
MFTFNAYDAQGVPHDESRILTQLIRVVEISPEKDVGVGILTAEDRDVWAKVYATLGQIWCNIVWFVAWCEHGIDLFFVVLYARAYSRSQCVAAIVIGPPR